jgi:sulfur relay (sulfurtransferase) DsrF/TusC family protein
MPIRNMCVVIGHPPYGREDAFAGLRTVAVCTTRGIPTDAVVTGEGVWNLVKEQWPERLHLPSNYDAVIDIVETGSKVYVDEESLKVHGLTADDILPDVTVLPFSEIADIILGHDSVFPLCGGF